MIPRCGPKNLYAEQKTTSAPRVATSIARCGARCTPSATRIASLAELARTIRTISADGLTDPTAFEASVNATIFVLGPKQASRPARSRVQSSSRIPTQRTSAPVSSATDNHGAMLASWSRTVKTISSPRESCRPIDLDSAKASVVVFGPKTISPGAPPRRSAAACLPSAMTRSVSRLVSKAPPVLAFDRLKYPAIAWMTVSGTWVPPGASANTHGRPSVVRIRLWNRFRTTDRSGSVTSP